MTESEYRKTLWLAFSLIFLVIGVGTLLWIIGKWLAVVLAILCIILGIVIHYIYGD